MIMEFFFLSIVILLLLYLQFCVIVCAYVILYGFVIVARSYIWLSFAYIYFDA